MNSNSYINTRRPPDESMVLEEHAEELEVAVDETAPEEPVTIRMLVEDYEMKCEEKKTLTSTDRRYISFIDEFFDKINPLGLPYEAFFEKSRKDIILQALHKLCSKRPYKGVGFLPYIFRFFRFMIDSPEISQDKKESIKYLYAALEENRRDFNAARDKLEREKKHKEEKLEITAEQVISMLDKTLGRLEYFNGIENPNYKVYRRLLLTALTLSQPLRNATIHHLSVDEFQSAVMAKKKNGKVSSTCVIMVREHKRGIRCKLPIFAMGAVYQHMKRYLTLCRRYQQMDEGESPYFFGRVGSYNLPQEINSLAARFDLKSANFYPTNIRHLYSMFFWGLEKDLGNLLAFGQLLGELPIVQWPEKKMDVDEMAVAARLAFRRLRQAAKNDQEVPSGPTEEARSFSKKTSCSILPFKSS